MNLIPVKNQQKARTQVTPFPFSPWLIVAAKSPLKCPKHKPHLHHDAFNSLPVPLPSYLALLLFCMCPSIHHLLLSVRDAWCLSGTMLTWSCKVPLANPLSATMTFARRRSISARSCQFGRFCGRPRVNSRFSSLVLDVVSDTQEFMSERISSSRLLHCIWSCITMPTS